MALLGLALSLSFFCCKIVRTGYIMIIPFAFWAMIPLYVCFSSTKFPDLNTRFVYTMEIVSMNRFVSSGRATEQS